MKVDSMVKNRFEDYLLSSIKEYVRTIVYADGEDIRLAQALKIFKDYNFSKVVLLGRENIIIENFKIAGITNRDYIKIIEPEKSNKTQDYTELLINTFKNNGKQISTEEARNLVVKPNYYATLMMKTGDADCGISGSLSSTKNMMRPLIQVLGTDNSKKYLSGAVMLDVLECQHGLERRLLFSDVAVIPEPDERQMMDIVLSSYQTAKALYEVEPKIALLSYSTKGSADSEKIRQIRKVIKEVKIINPAITIDGELQLDAAIIPEVAKYKCPDSEIAGEANVLIFPNLDSANICVKAVNRFTKNDYYGTIIQGSAIPFNDLSRGCNPIDILRLSVLTLMQLKMKNQSY